MYLLPISCFVDYIFSEYESGFPTDWLYAVGSGFRLKWSPKGNDAGEYTDRNWLAHDAVQIQSLLQHIRSEYASGVWMRSDGIAHGHLRYGDQVTSFSNEMNVQFHSRLKFGTEINSLLLINLS